MNYMEKYKIQALPSVLKQINDLVDILYNNNYFSEYNHAVEYVNDLINKIGLYLPISQAKIPLVYRPIYGKHTQYVTIHKNKNTSYFVFFLQRNKTYIITYIGNNHTDGQYLVP
ncbi:hypothetical protein FACS1894199_03830 [Bacteroidia bacterium]|nr:hypothetical protein FACS1894199_03830 [Bacteroidia bacterium]